MNYGISILFRAIPLAMAIFCFGYGAFIYGYGDDGSRVVAGPVVFSLGMICIALFCTAATIIRQIIHTYNKSAKYILPVIGYLAAIILLLEVSAFSVMPLPPLHLLQDTLSPALDLLPLV